MSFRRKLAVAAVAALSTVGLMQAPAYAAATPQGIVDVAEAQLGRYSCEPAFYGSCGIQWCAEFARWVWRTAGVQDWAGLDSWAQSFKTYGQKHGTYHSRSSGYRPQPGDAIVFDWERNSDDDHPIDHVAIVTGTRDGRVHTIGGNQGPEDSHYDRRVTRGAYPLSSAAIDGYTTATGVSAGAVVDEPPAPYSVTGDSFADLIGTKPDGTMVMYANNIIRDEGKPYDRDTTIGQGWNGDHDQVLIADATGDGYTDLVARKTDGSLWLYENNIERDNGDPYRYGKRIGHGWNGYDKLIGADVTGDGFTDLVARKNDGTLWLYANNYVRDGGLPYNAAPKQIGFSGWSSFNTLIGADVTGDGFTDLVARKPNGDLYLYPNNIGRDNGKPYEQAPKAIGQGWDAFTAVVGAYVTGDGFTDLVARKPNGDLYLYPNNIGRDNGKPYEQTPKAIGQGWNAFNRIL